MVWIKSPLRSLGSNQVDLGGMISPASATRKRSAMVTGYREKASAKGYRMGDRVLRYAMVKVAN